MPVVSLITATIEQVLLETDVPDLVLARDAVDTLYLCSLVSRDDAGDRFLVVPISGERLADLRSGRIDLRSALADAETKRYFDGRFHRIDGEPSIYMEPIEHVPDQWLPDSGFLLSRFEETVSNEEVVREAVTRNATVIVCGVNPPESRGSVPKIDADRLADAIKDFQALVKYATRKVISRMPDMVRANYPEDAYVLRVCGFSPGSFNVHFESKGSLNLFGSSVVGEAMREVDTLMELSGKSADEALEGFRRSGGGMVLQAYHSLMRFIHDQNSPLSYRWSEPAALTAHGHAISTEAASAMAAILESEESLREDPFTFRGQFTSVNTDHEPFSWVARDSENKVKRGVLHQSSPNILGGATIRTRQYVFSGQERLVRLASGKQTPKLFLKSVREVAQ